MCNVKQPEFRPRNTQRARALRNAPSPAEYRLWHYLSKSQIDGNKFTRQFQIGNYYADFACRKKKIIIELDGVSHDMQQRHDEERSLAIEGEGYLILRYTNTDVLGNIEGVLLDVAEKLRLRPTPGPSRTREGS